MSWVLLSIIIVLGWKLYDTQRTLEVYKEYYRKCYRKTSK